MPCLHNLEQALSAYVDGPRLAADTKGPFFRTIGRGTGELTGNWETRGWKVLLDKS
ncbi:MAG: hypothetical protein ABSG47_14840 [Terracidiphilus sp.]|jgi:integrase/recombinase XerC